MKGLKVGVVYRNITVTGATLAGGGDLFVVHLLNVIEEQGHKVILATTKKTDWGAVERAFGKSVRPDLEVRSTFFPRSGGLRLYRDLIPSLAVERLKKKCDITFNAYGDDPFWDTDFIYMHTPITGEEIKVRYGRSLLSRLYFGLYHTISRRLAKGLRTKILTNSDFSRQCIKYLLGLESQVMYPPVDTVPYKKLLNSRDRERRVATVGRFSLEKNFEVIPSIAKKAHDTHFHIIGTHVGSQSEAVLREVRKRSRQLDVKDRIHIHLNASKEEKMAVLSRCRVYLHTRPREYFGMAIAEAMSGGLVPVVHSSGGPVEIVRDDQLVYTDLEEASTKVQYWLDNWSFEYSEELSMSAERFGLSRFSNEVKGLLYEVRPP